MRRQNLKPMSSSPFLSVATAICITGLAACAPLPPKAVIVKDNIVKGDVAKDQDVTILPVEVIIDNVTEITAPKELIEEAQDNTTIIDQAAKADDARDNQTETITEDIRELEQPDDIADEVTDDVIEDSQQKIVAFTAPKPISPQTLLTEPLKPKPQEPDPLDPYIFLDKSQSYLFDIMGKPDDQFTEQGIQIGQYRESSCHLLTFLASQQGSLHVIHIDVRPALLDTALDKDSCYKAFGKRADQIQNN